MSEITKSMLSPGASVEVNPRSDRSRKILISGVVSKILTSSDSHPHGILVELECGEVGRVKQILSGVDKSPSVTLEPAEGVNNEPSYETISVEEVIDGGENHFAEFKSSSFWSQGFSKEEIARRNIQQYGAQTSRVVIAKSIAGFLNADGGRLLIGVKEVKESDDVEIIGIDSELSKLKDKTLDGYRREIVDTVVRNYFPSFVFHGINNFMRISFNKINSSNVCMIEVLKSDKRVFLKIKNEDTFIVRIDASSRQVTGEDMVEYCLDRFK